MREQWRKLAAKFDARAPRERILIFAGVIVAVVLLFDTFALNPLSARHRFLTKQLAETRQNIKTADSLVKAQETAADPDAVKRSYREALRKQLAEIDENMKGLQKGLVPPERMARLLEELLGKSRGLQLVSLRTLPVQRFETPGAPPKAADKGAKVPPRDPERSIYQHSFEITLTGSYVDLHDYLVRLEQLPAQMFWGRLNLDAGESPRLSVTLLVHTLSLSKAWLVV